MTDAEKAEMFDKIQSLLWRMAVAGNIVQSTIGSALIRELQIPGPNGEDPGEA